jgi:RNA polymerase sigma factor (sigma-70 family)
MPEEPAHRRDFAGLYRATIAPLQRYLARLLGNATEAQDVAHDAYLRVYPKVQDRSAEKPEAVLYTTARRLAINRLKRRSITPITSTTPTVDFISTEPGVVQQVMARQELKQLEAAIAELPEGCRAVLLLRKIELRSHQEIAEQLGIAISTVEKQHARALRLLRLALLPAPALAAPNQANPPGKEARQ